MVKNYQTILSITAILLAIVSFYFSRTSSELVYVDVNKLMEGYKRTKIAKADFEEKVSGMKANVDSLMTGWQKELQAYEKERASLSPKELKLKQELLNNKQQQLNGYQEAMQKKAQEENTKTTQTVVNDINDYIKEYGKKHGYKIIFGASGGGNIMYAAEATDLTEEVLKGLNSEYVVKK